MLPATIKTGLRSLHFGGLLLTLGAILAITAGVVLAFTPSAFVNFTLEACNLPDSDKNGIPDYSLPIGGLFICADANYTTGNLGKSWNELDLVPHRLTTTLGSQEGATTKYNVLVAADYQTGSAVGYDVISVPTVNAGKSHPSCAVSAGPQQNAGAVTGGADAVIYRVLEIDQEPGSTCVFDYYQRLALGAHLYPGSSLQSYMFEQEDFNTGKRTLSIPVREILPQELDKNMTASQGSVHSWTLSKSATPASLNFANTCDPAQALALPVQFTVTWEKLAAVPGGPVTMQTQVHAVNPASRTITVSVTDRIYEGTAQTTLLDTASSGSVNVPPFSTTLVLTHTFVWNTPTPGVTMVNDVATATYTDLVTGVPVPGQTTASASAAIQLTGDVLNATAVISDTETITPGAQFSVDAFSGAAGAFSGYTAGTKTAGPVAWTLDPVSASGSVTFDKTVYVDKGAVVASGSLSDQALLTGSSGFTAQASAGVTINANAQAELTIDKTIPNVLSGAETVTFTFQVKNAADALVASPTITFAAGETAKSVKVSGLPLGQYTVSEDPLTGWQAQAPRAVDLRGSICAASASFTNALEPVSARARKVTDPAGLEAGWQFQLYQGVTLLETVTTTGAGYINFTTPLAEGSYSIVEVEQAGWRNDGPSGECAFTVDLPANAGHVYDCTFTNTQLARILVDKVTNPPGAMQIFNFRPSYAADFILTDGDPPHDSGYLNPGAYAVEEVDIPGGWTLTSAACSDGSPVSAIALGPGETVTCTFTDTQRGRILVDKVTDPAGSAQSFEFDPDYGANFFLTDAALPNDSGYLDAGTYAVSELVPDGWELVSASCSDGSPVSAVDLGVGETVLCTFANRQQARLLVDKVTYPAGSAQSFEFDPSVGDNFFLLDADPLKDLGYLTPGVYSVAEIDPGAEWIQTGASCSDGSPVSAIDLAPGEEVTCAFVNTQRGRVEVRKTFQGAPPTGDQSFTFELRENASIYSDGHLLETRTADASNGGVIQFATLLTPDTPYQMCEHILPGWLTSLGEFVPGSFMPPNGYTPNPDVDNSIVCINFSAPPGQTMIVMADNTPPPGGRALTIGFWKNWASCAKSNGKQAPVLDQTLAAAMPEGIPIGLLTLTGDPLAPDTAPSCAQAVGLLNKSNLSTGKKMASDPLYNMAAQLVAVQLNLNAEAYVCGRLLTSVANANALLTKYSFNGTGAYTKLLSAEDKLLAAQLAQYFDDYNNNRGGVCP